MKKVNCAIISLLAACLVLLMVVLILLGTGVIGVGNATNNGKSAYELAVEAGFKGTYEQWLESLKGSNGSNGSNGKSAFEIFKEYNPDYTGTEEEWLESLKGDRGATWFSGTGVPTEVEGARDGDFYLLVYGDFSSKKGFVIYQMTDGQWVALVDMSSDVTSDDRQDMQEFHVRSADDFAGFSESVNAGDDYKGKTIKLEDDLDLSSVENWTPIGSTSATRFRGEFDGAGHTISNLTVTSSKSHNALFGYVGPDRADSGEKSSIHDVIINNATVTGAGYSATLVAYTFTDTEIYNITVTGDIKVSAKTGSVWSDARVGAVVGSLDYSKLHDVTVDVNEGSIVETDGPYAGGVVGWVAEGGNRVFSNLKSNVDVYAGWIAGGIFGMLHYGTTARDCTVEGATITTPGSRSGYTHALGGIAGNTSTVSESPVVLDNCKFNGTLVNETTPENICAYGLTGPTQNLTELGANVKIINSVSQAMLSSGSVIKASWDENGEATVA